MNRAIGLIKKTMFNSNEFLGIYKKNEWYMELVRKKRQKWA
jgi:hypothetical protein